MHWSLWIRSARRSLSPLYRQTWQGKTRYSGCGTWVHWHGRVSSWRRVVITTGKSFRRWFRPSFIPISLDACLLTAPIIDVTRE